MTESTTHAAPQHHAPKHTVKLRVTKRLLAVVAVVVIVVLLIAPLAATAVSLYAKPFHTAMTDKIAMTLPFPAMSVNGKTTSYQAFMMEFGTVKKLLGDQQVANGGSADVKAEDVANRILERSKRIAAVQKIATEKGITVTAEDTEQVKSQFVYGFPTEDDYKKALMDRYGWTPEVFEQYVIVPFTLERKLLMNTTAKELANTALAELQKPGADFAGVAGNYSGDSSSANGGDLGWFKRGVMIKPFEDAAFALKKGEMTGLVETQFGYHIIKLDDRRTVKTTAKDANGKNVTTSEEEIHARHILIRPDANDGIITDEMKNIEAKLLVKI